MVNLIEILLFFQKKKKNHIHTRLIRQIQIMWQCVKSVFFSQSSIKIMDSGYGLRAKINIFIRHIIGARNIKHVFDFRRGKKKKKKYQTLYDPRFLTEHPSFTLRPAGTVTFSIGSVNSGSSVFAEKTKRKNFIYFYCECFRNYLCANTLVDAFVRNSVTTRAFINRSAQVSRSDVSNRTSDKRRFRRLLRHTVVHSERQPRFRGG